MVNGWLMSFLPRDSGEGGPPCAAGWWKGRRTRHATIDSRISPRRGLDCSPTATKLRVRRPLHHGSLAARAPVVPLPRFAGADGACALVLAAHVRPRLADQSHEFFRLKIMKGGGAPKRRNCPVGPRHASDVATQTRFGHGRALIGARSPFGAPPRRSPGCYP
jgi:hypothetical protein